eukprot:TRINITY_DN3207_c0_g1_i1.p1 TRINITY_DN3207_c0_g1~~TRINITY_DN3207_c0_g1_i1.p1  ORF type:complete len:294 (-),score=49.65 TRINITY_DN3207_c0_g1_i1:234-1082(-)
MAEVDGSTQTEQDTLDLHKLNTDPCEEKERVQINNTSHASSTTPPLSKTQLKKRKKYEQLQEQYKAKKLKQKEQKVQTRAKRAEEKKIFLETRTPEQIAEFEERRNKAKMDLKQQKEDRNTRLTEVYANPRAQPIVCIDCSFNDKMTSKEMTSLAHQLSYCYSHNSKSEKPLCLAISSLQGELLTHFQRYSGSDKWRIIKDQEHFTKIFPGPETIVYLSADSPNTLTSLEAGTVYVLGGLVDRNRYKVKLMYKIVIFSIMIIKCNIEEHLPPRGSEIWGENG